MKKPLCISLVVVTCAAQAQEISQAYNRDNHDKFALKNLSSVSVVKGPIVTQEATYTFDNPYKKLTEASVWFELDTAAILSGFGYWYKNEYVPGVLMDKDKAWFIYTAITSRNEDPGIMVQTTPSSYHAQIFPLATGYDFRVKLNSVGFLQPVDGQLMVSQPTFEGKPSTMVVRAADPSILKNDASTPSKTFVNYPKDPNLDMKLYAQKHKDGYTYVAGMLRTDKPDAEVKVSGIHKVYWSRPNEGSDGTVKLFIGRRKGPGTVKVLSNDKIIHQERAQVIKANEKGSDTAKLWAHQKLVQDDWHSNKSVLAFSLKYQIPSAQTALLAVPQEEMAIFKRKAAEYRRHQAEEARKERAWQRQRRQNWSTSSGGDPEVRVYLPNAKRAYAVLPDGRTFDLIRAENGYWGGNYDIPADAPEGDYTVKVYGVNGSGEKTDETVTYKVDRTPPQGTLKLENGFLVLTSEKDLAKVVVVFSDGTEDNMVQMEPGIYKIPVAGKRVVKVVMIDRAHNLAEAKWSQ